MNVSKNRIVEIPQSICNLKNLRKLNVERNCLLNVPLQIAQMTLLELQIGHNRIEELADDIFFGPLGQTLRLFSCPENNLSELPISISELDPEVWKLSDVAFFLSFNALSFIYFVLYSLTYPIFNILNVISLLQNVGHFTGSYRL